MGARLSKTTIQYSELEFEETIQVVDSMCTLATLQNETSALREYMGNRSTEVLSVTPKENIYHVRSKLYISDLGTRADVTVEDISPGSDWQCGTDWMRLPREDWPLTQDTKGVTVPKEELRKVGLVAVVTTEAHSIDINRFKGKSYTLLVRTIALLFKIAHCRSFKAASTPIDYSEIKLAESVLVKMSMIYTQKEFEAGKQRSLGAAVNETGII